MEYLISILFLILSDFYNAQSDFYSQLSNAALELTKQHVTYDPGYFSIPYPNGDVPGDKGVCTDVIIRAYRALGIDLQKEVHEDMKANFSVYPKNWGLTKPDPNIDHRRVPNLMVFFARKGITLPITQKPEDYFPGDIVCWDLGNGIIHTGFVVNSKSTFSDRYQIVHNIGNGQVIEDCLFRFKIIGHYRYGDLNHQIMNGIIDQKEFKKLLKKNINLRYLYEYEPMVSARLVTQPTLIINGESDKNVPPEDALKLKMEMNKYGYLNVTTNILKHHNHLLLPENQEGQINSTKITDETLKIILDWILAEL